MIEPPPFKPDLSIIEEPVSVPPILDVALLLCGLALLIMLVVR